MKFCLVTGYNEHARRYGRIAAGNIHRFREIHGHEFRQRLNSLPRETHCYKERPWRSGNFILHYAGLDAIRREELMGECAIRIYEKLAVGGSI